MRRIQRIQLSVDGHDTLSVNAEDLRYVLGKINANRHDFVHGRFQFSCGS